MRVNNNKNISFSGWLNLDGKARAENKVLRPLYKQLKHYCGNPTIRHTVILGNNSLQIRSDIAKIGITSVPFPGRIMQDALEKESGGIKIRESGHHISLSTNFEILDNKVVSAFIDQLGEIRNFAKNRRYYKATNK